MWKWLRHFVRAGVVAAPVLAAAACQSLRPHPIGGCDDGECEDPGLVHGLHEPRVTAEPSVMALASDLDHLERHIDWYGSVVAKTPDVWGQARLTEHRQDFEDQMKSQLGGFTVKLNGSLSRSDQAYAAYAQTLSLAAAAQSGGGATAVPTPSTETAVTQDVVASGARVGNGGTADINTPAGALNVFGGQSPTGGFFNLQRTVPAASGGGGGGGGGGSGGTAPVTNSAADPGTILAGGSGPAISRNAVSTRTIGFGATGTAGVALEPTLELAQRKRYLDFLNQLRRENEGDDTADSPGYSLNLLRVPVSVLPGKRTDVGFGAEIAMTLTPVLGEDLLPMTFRNFVINDLVQQFGFPLAKFLDEERYKDDQKKLLTADIQQFLQGLEIPEDKDKDRAKAEAKAKTARIIALANVSTSRQRGRSSSAAKTYSILPDDSPKDAAAKIVHSQLSIPSLSFSNGLNARQAYPTSQLIDVLGVRYSFEIAYGAQVSLDKEIKWIDYIHLPDVQSYLQEELRAAYQFLVQPNNQCLWAEFCNPELVAVIRSQQWKPLENPGTLGAIRQRFVDRVQVLTGSSKVEGKPDEKGKIVPTAVGETRQFSKTSALAWAIVVDSALLTDRLLRDMRETATAKGHQLAGCEHWCQYYLPDPPPECRQAFNAYVALRWPIHVFALDPYTQDQNLADSLSTRREMQLALAVAFTQGQIGSRSLMQYARRLEAEYETIALNRTQVGFAHGENTFGWRFYPRFQTPDTESNMTVLVRDLLIGGPNRNQLLRQRRLEPGPRECVAVVMMPSFVPYVTLDTVSNWFPLTNPKHKVLDHTEAMRLSHTVQAIRTAGCGVQDAAKFRQQDLGILLRRVGQLEARLPTQTMTNPVPILNTLGGFEMFSNGTTDLAPELYGWYGAPGLDPDTDTTLFLVGDHFSPLRTKVIVGNKAIPDTADKPNKKMLSRQVMQVTVPAGAFGELDQSSGDYWVRVHVATPYGVTRELEVPLIRGGGYKKPDPTPGFSFGDAKLTAKYGMAGTVGQDGKPTGFFTPVPQGADDDLKINWVAPGNTLTPLVQVTFEFTYQTATLTVPCRVAAVGHVDGKAKTVVIKKEEMSRVADELVRQIASVSPVLPSDSTNPLAKGLTSTKVTVTPFVPGWMVTQGVETTDQLKVAFKATGVCPPAAQPVPVPLLPGMPVPVQVLPAQPAPPAEKLGQPTPTQPTPPPEKPAQQGSPPKPPGGGGK